MTDKSNDTPAATGSAGGTPPSTAEQEAVSTTGSGVSSPFDSPTEQLSSLGKGPELTKDVPRTDDELGLDPEVPAVGEQANQADTAPAYAYASIPPAANPPSEPSRPLRRRNGDNRRGTLDLGLFVLRLVIGGTFIYHGLMKLAGWFHGPGLDGTRDMMANGGWDHPTMATILVTAGELGGGGLLVLGLATPLAAGAVLAVILDAWAWKQGMLPGFQYKVATGVELESILAGAAAVIILTGPGRLSFDRNRGWATRPAYGSFAVLILAIAAAVGTWIWLHGGNPLIGIGPW
ncbi:DoxX family protein [Nocardia sp. CWNU-33]|uniref:DoxX family protein n=1 Tax=Nocardia sp. CWNU-33 TaxID=3392117 RepID=UPI00398F4213